MVVPRIPFRHDSPPREYVERKIVLLACFLFVADIFPRNKIFTE